MTVVVRTIGLVVVVATLVLSTAVFSTARAEAASVNRADFERLVTDARAGDDDALAELRGITEVDGAPVDLAVALDTGDPEELRRRLDVLTEEAGVVETPTDPAAVRDRARDILDDDEFTRARLPRPLKGLIEWIADALSPVTDVVERIWANVVTRVLFVGVLLGAGAIFLAMLARRRLRPPVERLSSAAGDLGHELLRLDPAELDRRAAEAGRAAAYDREIRLRFVAGLLRLERAGRIRAASVSPSLTLRGELADPTFDQLAASFDEVVYGDRPATEADAAAARAGWAALVGGSGVRSSAGRRAKEPAA